MTIRRLALSSTFAQVLLASGTGLLSPMGYVAGVKETTGIRQLVELSNRGDVLAGRANGRVIQAIAVAAPGLERALVSARERHIDSKFVLVQIVAPKDLERMMLRTTLFLEPGVGDRLHQLENGQWIPRPMERIALGERNVLAASVNNFGLMLFDKGNSPPGPHWPTEFGAFDPSVRVERAGWNLVWPGVALAILMVASERVHSRGRRPNQ